MLPIRFLHLARGWGLKGQPAVLQEANVRVDLNREWLSHWPFAPTDHRSQLTPKRVTIETPAAIGRRIEVIADHERVWARHLTISDPGHVAAARMLRRERVAVLHPVPELDVEQRSLGDYDTALGIELNGGVA